MKKLSYIFTIALLALACSQDDTEEVNPDDLDGDGVTNQQETVDGTDPNRGCDYIASNQFFPATSQTWRNGDCDGDGVTNGDEIDPDGNNTNDKDGTDPRNQCDFNSSQQTVDPREQWLNDDCDEDGVLNRQEVTDGTDPLDPCSLVVASQTRETGPLWNDSDCDGDCVSNAREVADGTNFQDPSDFLGNGQTLTQVRLESFGNFAQVAHLDQQGERLLRITDFAGSELGNYQYNGNNQLITATLVLSNGATRVYNYEYAGDNLTKITVGNTEQTIEYQGNEIISRDGNEPAGLFTKRLTLDSSGQRILKFEHYVQEGNIYEYRFTDFNYDATTQQLTSYFMDLLGYDPITEEYFDIDSTGVFEFGYSTTFNNTAVNPLAEAAAKVKIPTLFDPIILSPLFYGSGLVYVHFEAAHLGNASFGNNFVDGRFNISLGCFTTNNRPTRGERFGELGDKDGDLIYIYD